ncbi:MAG: DciA family protein [Planctomycetota bacterium]
MDDNERFRSFGKVGVQRRTGSRGTATLGDAVKHLVDGRISPRQARFDSLIEIWNQLLPAELGRHCRLVDASGGQLKVLADSPAYVHELRLCSSQLIEELRRQCPRARIRTIRIVIG